MTVPGGMSQGMSEAARIINRLHLSGMKRAEIARQLGVTAETIRDISRGKNSGNSHLAGLRGMQRYVQAVSPTPAESSGTATAESTPVAETPATGTADPAIQALLPTLETVDAPRDERSGAEKFKAGLKDALLGKSQPGLNAPAKRGKGEADQGAELVEQLVPMLALLVVVFSHALTPVRYSAAAPTHAEAAAILTPLVRSMTRQLDVAGQLTPTQMDIMQALMAATVYGYRAFSVVQSIRAEEARTYEAPRAPEPRQQQAQQAAAASVQRPVQPAAGYAQSVQPAMATSSGHTYGLPANGNGHHATPAGGDGGNPTGQADPFAAIYAADARGRAQLGIN